MSETRITAGAHSARVISCGTAVVGTGAAGYNAADRLWQLGRRDVLIVTERRTSGTSRNTGSDKQTYYKLTLGGGEGDSVREMAQTLFEGGAADGDLALVEAALSARSFLKLAELGVPFPRNRYGEFVGYKTDHDPRQRATSVGPYTSKEMTEKLEAACLGKEIPILDRTQVIQIISENNKLYGLLCLNIEAEHEQDRFIIIRCRNVVYAVGGPAGMYRNSVYPPSQFGASGIALEAGVMGRNLTEWQYGLASVMPRWNVSGTYMQVLPRVYSCLPDGSDEQEFLLDFFDDSSRVLSLLFLKGYQWPFDVRRVASGSSIIDILVYLETGKGRKVYLDYRDNPGRTDIDFAGLDPEARDYLERAGACFGTPIDRLRHMNQPAVDFYLGKGVDLTREPLEIALSAQHNNGGLAVDCWWQTNLEGFFAAGEAAGTHGVYRPGGSALNSGQVGSTRAAEYIAALRVGAPEEGFEASASKSLAAMAHLAEQALTRENNLHALWEEAGIRMSRCGAAIRDEREIPAYRRQVRQWLDNLGESAGAGSPAGLSRLFRLRDMLISQYVYLAAMEDYIRHGGRSRGSALYTDPAGEKPYPELTDTFAFKLDKGALDGEVQEVSYQDGDCRFSWRPVRPIPQTDDFFENVWRTYRENMNIE